MSRHERLYTPLTTRLFPKAGGADRYRISGLAARCDWVVLSDTQPPCHSCVRNRLTDTPRHIFLSLRNPFHAIRHFAQDVLPGLTAPFILISGSEDATLPRQTDRRWRPFDAEERALIARILASPLLVRWFVENLDDPAVPKMVPLPLGRVFPEGQGAVPLPEVGLALPERPLRVLCGHRLRPGPQWETRRHVTDLARGPWAEFTTLLQEDLSEPDFLAQVAGHSFVLCVEGGGVDPSPKAWQVLEQGAIPIIRSHSLAAAYARLPVVIVPDWAPGHITPAALALWRAQRAPQFAEGPARQKLLHRLSLDFWWGEILAAWEEAQVDGDVSHAKQFKVKH